MLPLGHGVAADHHVAHVVPGVELRAQRLAAVAVDERGVPGGLQLRARGVELTPVGRHRGDTGLLERGLVVEADVELVLQRDHVRAVGGVKAVAGPLQRVRVDPGQVRRGNLALEIHQEVLVLQREQPRPHDRQIRAVPGDRRGLKLREVVAGVLADHVHLDIAMQLLERLGQILQSCRVLLGAVVVPDGQGDRARRRAAPATAAPAGGGQQGRGGGSCRQSESPHGLLPSDSPFAAEPAGVPPGSLRAGPTRYALGCALHHWALHH